MGDTKEIKERIASIQQTRKITNAMHLISSSKMKQAKENLAKTEPFFFSMQNEIARILSYRPQTDNFYFDNRSDIKGNKRTLGIIVITADKGLAGAYNHNIFKETEKLISRDETNILMVLGEVGRHYFESNHKNIQLDTDFKYTVQKPTLHRARLIADKIVNMYLSKELDEVHIIYTKMNGSLSAEAESLELLPLNKSSFNTKKFDDKQPLTFYPSASDLMNSVVPIYITGIIYGCLVESYCSEHSCRMQAMLSATNSADDMLSELNITYNRVRQANITQEITEVAAGSKNKRK